MHNKNKIIDIIVSSLQSFSFSGNRSSDTSKIKELIANICRESKLNVWASSLERTDKNKTQIHTSNHEWLYDLICYRFNRNRHYAITELYLVMECEWGGRRYCAEDNKDSYGEVKYDFQKLFVCNSPLKLMVFKKHGNDEETNELLNYFQERINESVYSRPEETFIIAYYYYDKKDKKYKCITKLYNKHEKII